MASVSYNARERRLVLDGPCWPDDAPGVAEAIDTFAEPDRMLVVDLTRLVDVPAEVSDAVEGARRSAEDRGCHVHLWAAAALETAV